MYVRGWYFVYTKNRNSLNKIKIFHVSAIFPCDKINKKVRLWIKLFIHYVNLSTLVSSKTETKKMVPWNSFPLQIIYQVFGWLAFLSWSLAGYPQLISNFRRKRLVNFFIFFSSFLLHVFINLFHYFSYDCFQCGGVKLRLYNLELY